VILRRSRKKSVAALDAAKMQFLTFVDYFNALFLWKIDAAKLILDHDIVGNPRVYFFTGLLSANFDHPAFNGTIAKGQKYYRH
jgi:hypothetical protein